MPEYPQYTVGELTRRIKELLMGSFRRVIVQGELSGFKIYGSGHAYFNIKDAEAQIPAVMFASSLARIRPEVRAALVDGVKLDAFGEVTVYASRGNYQLTVLTLRLAGVGDLMVQFEALKKKLAVEGLFDAARKRPIPFLPRRIAIVTSPSGAVIHDMCTVLGRRYPNVQIRLYPVRVQGEGAAHEIAAGIAYFNAATDWRADVLIVGRGGGSIEDLWAFNEEPVVRGVAASEIPVISAVGHETDFTLCDFAADVRAPTPSAAAELAVPVKRELVQRVTRLNEALARAARHTTDRMRARLDACRRADVLRRPQCMVDVRAQQLDILNARLGELTRVALARGAQRLAGFSHERLLRAVRQATARAHVSIDTASKQLALLSPYGVLARGYTLTRAADGTLLRSAQTLAPGDVIQTQFADGTCTSRVGDTP